MPPELSRLAADGADVGGRADAPAPIFPAVVVATVSVMAAWTLACSLLLVALDHSEHLEFALYLLGFPVAIPLAVVGAWRLALRARSRQIDLRPIAAVAGLGLGAAVLAARLIDGTGSTAGWIAAPGASLLAIGTVVALEFELVRDRRLGGKWREWAGAHVPVACAAGVLLACAAFLPRALAGVGPLLIAALVGALLAVALAARGRVRMSGWRAPAFDVLVVLAIVVLATDVEFPPAPVDENLFLGAINDVLHGKAMLVDASSQYGVGNIYALALIFKVVPLGYCTFEFVHGVLWLIFLCCIYAILRVARLPRLLAVLGTALVMLSSIYAQMADFGSFVGYPSTGPLRFGLPFLVVLAMVAAARRERQTVAHAVAVATVALASVWSFETFVYVAAAFLAASAMETVSRDGGVRRFLWFVAAGAAACIGMHAVFAVGTRWYAGAWPDWLGYLEYIRLYGSKGFGQVPVESWSVGLPMAFFYFASAVALVSFAIWGREEIRQRPEIFVGLAALTALSVSAYTYFLGRSAVNNLHHVATPAIALAALWAGLFATGLVRAERPVRIAGLALALAAGSLVIAENATDVRRSWHHTLLYRATPILGHGSLRDSVSLRWDNPVSDPRALIAERLLAEELPNERRTVVLAWADLTVEFLIRSGRVNALPVSDFVDADLVPGTTGRVMAAIDRLPAGTHVLLQVDATGRVDLTQLDGIQRDALLAIAARFDYVPLRTLAPFTLYRLEPKAGAAS